MSLGDIKSGKLRQFSITQPFIPLAFVAAVGGVGFEDIAVSAFQLFQDGGFVDDSGPAVVGECAEMNWVFAVLGIEGAEFGEVFAYVFFHNIKLEGFLLHFVTQALRDYEPLFSGSNLFALSRKRGLCQNRRSPIFKSVVKHKTKPQLSQAGGYEILEETVPNHYFYISEWKVQDVSVKAVKYADEWASYDYENLYFTKEEAEAALEKRRREK